MTQHTKIPLNKRNLFLGLIGSIGFVALGWLLLTNTANMSDDPLFIKIIGIASMLFFGYCGLHIYFKIIDKKPGLVVSDQGITDNASAISAGLIKWHEIKEIELQSVFGQEFITIVVHNPEKFIKRHTGLEQAFTKANDSIFASPIQIPFNSLSLNKKEIISIIKQYQTKH